MFKPKISSHVFVVGFTAATTFSVLSLLLSPEPAMAQGNVIETPATIPELPLEVETEVGPAGSLKIIPLWKETIELIEDPHAYVCPPGSVECTATTERRPFFNPTTGAEEDTMPPLRVFDACHNVLTGQPLRTRPDDEIDWNQPGPLFDPDEVVPVGADPTGIGPSINVPLALRTVIGSLEVNAENELYVSNPGGDPRIPPDGTVIAEPACNDAGQLVEDGILVDELEQPVNETHFIKDRLAAEVLGKSLFWDMQVGSDAVQACGSCHFHAGVDDRTRNQLNPDTNGGDNTLQVRGPNEDVVADDFPFHKLIDPDIVGEPLLNPGNVISDANDVMSSMGVSEFKQFDDVLVGSAGFGPPGPNGVRTLVPDVGDPMVAEPIGSMIDENGNKLRRVEPRHTPTFHAAAFNFDNFWDGRARHDFNGGSVFGPADPFFHVYVGCGPGGPPVNRIRQLAAPLEAEFDDPADGLCEWTEVGGNYLGVTEAEEPVPVRIRFSSLASQAVGPPLSDFEMAFGFVDPDVRGGRNWQKIGKKLLQGAGDPFTDPDPDRPFVTPLANQLVATDDSRIGPWSNQGGSECLALGRPTAAGKPGLCTTYPELIRMAFRDELWSGDNGRRLAGTEVPMNNACNPGEQIHELDVTPTCDPFDGYVLQVQSGNPNPTNTNQFNIMEANFSLFFGLSVQAYEQLTIPDHTPWDQFNDQYPLLGNGVAQPGEQGTLIPSVIRELVTGSPDPNVTLDTTVLGPDGEDVLFGFDIFAGGNLTAALPVGSRRNPAAIDPLTGQPLTDPVTGALIGVGSNPFLRTARCMLCHLGPEQSDHTNNVNAGLLQSGTEVEFPTPPTAPEPTGVLRLVTGFSLAEELEENAQDGVEVENRNFNFLDDPATPWDDRVIGTPSAVAFQDNGIYNITVRPTNEDLLRGGDDPFGWPLALAALAIKNLGGIAGEPFPGEDCTDADNIAGLCFEPCDTETEAATRADGCAMSNFDSAQGPGGGLYEEVGEGFPFDGTAFEQDSINPGFELEPANPLLPEYLAEWANNLPAGELSPLIDELAFAPNTVNVIADPVNTPVAPVAEFGEILFGADLHCGVYDPGTFGAGPPNFGWGPLCPNSQSGVAVNMQLGDAVVVPGSLVAPMNGTFPFPNRVARMGAAKVPPLRNVELTGPYFHTGSYLTLRQVIDFYMRGGDFPITNSEDRDPNLVELNEQAFGFGSTLGLPVQFQDAIPDAMSQYGQMPDTAPPGCFTVPRNCTPEPLPPDLMAGEDPRAVALEDAKTALVKLMIAFTDERVAFRKPPFDQPEIFAPIDGRSPQNGGATPAANAGRGFFVGLAGVVCDPLDITSTGICFEQVPATGAAGQATRLANFLGISSTPVPGPNNDHFDR